ncbi:MAG: ABC transporter ATP-binding protein [Clostridiales bacterium]|nr:ABC transporter ATP-binding protein [Clostridiales bacterium]
MTDNGDRIIVIDGLKKSFGEIRAVDDISFEVRRGELFAFLGVNGAGKSTTISMLCGNLDRDGGHITVDGMDVDKDMPKIKREIGVVFQSCVLDQMLTVRENLKSRAALYGIFKQEFEARYKELDEMLALKEIENRPLSKLSGGQRRRCDIARALLHRPKILILDEPTTGLDPQTRKTVWSVIDALRHDGMTVFLTTHYMEEAADADYVVIIDSGRIIAKGTPVTLKNQYTGDFVSFYDKTEDELAVLGMPVQRIAGGCRIELENTAQATSLIKAHPELFTDYEISKGKMDDVFLAATGKKLVGDN